MIDENFIFQVGDLVMFESTRQTEDFTESYEVLGIVVGHEKRYSKQEHICRVQTGFNVVNVRTHQLTLVNRGAAFHG